MAKLIEFDFLVTPDNETYCLHDGSSRFLVTAVNPLGMSGINIETQRAPGQHGETPLSYNLLPRTLTMVHRRPGKDRDDYWELRQDIINNLRPNRQTSWGAYEPFRLIKQLPDGSEWTLDVYWSGGLDFRERPTWDEWSAQDAIRFTAYTPTFYDRNGTSVTLSLVVAGTELTFPCAFPIIFQAEDTLDDSDTISYTGTWEAFPVIEIDGPVTNVTITNSDTGEKIELEYTIPIGVTVTIDCSAATKTVVDSLGVNLVGAVSNDSDLGTFHLAPNPESPAGVNTISVFGLDAATGITEVRFQYYTRMVGL